MAHKELVPFQSRLSFGPLVESLRGLSGPQRQTCEGFLTLVQELNLLADPVDPKILEAHPEVLTSLASLFFSPVPSATDYSGILVPFNMKPLYMTPALAQVFHWKETQGYQQKASGEGLLLLGYGLILRQFLGWDPQGLPQPLLWFEDEQGFKHATQIHMDTRFCRIRCSEPDAFQDPHLKNKILEALKTPEILPKLLPPDWFTFEGLYLMTAIDVTSQALISDLKYHLIDQSQLIQGGRVQILQTILRNLLHQNSVHFKLAVRQGQEILFITSEEKASCLFEACSPQAAKMMQSPWVEEVYQHHRPLFKDRTQDGAWPHWDSIPEDVQTFWAVPLKEGGKMLGVGILYSPEPGILGPGTLGALSEVWPLLALALRRALEEFDHEVEGVIRREYTSIHPAVDWVFRQRAFEVVLARQNGDSQAKPGLIKFSEVYPLYALSDIRNSSVLRAQAITEDLNTQLDLASQVLHQAWIEKSLPILEEMQFRLDHQKSLLSDGLNTGDETSVAVFLKQEFEPLLKELEGFGPRSRQAVEFYLQALDGHTGSVYRRRKALDDSIRRVNQVLGDLMESSQVQAQAMYPHYFDKTSTDGVDMNIYLGPGMAEVRPWNKIYLQNLRLWQLLVLIRGAQEVLALKSSLPQPLDLAHLVMVQDLPLEIYFRMDEKRFAVEGAYNIRYELIKKRIDKARVKATGERLTQVGALAVVFSRSEEGREYRQYLEFLQGQGDLIGDVEELELEDLQGVHGLKAFRISVNPQIPAHRKPLWDTVTGHFSV